MELAQAEDHGLTLLGLHWLLARTEGLCLTSAEAGVRQRTADYLVELARCCADLGGDLLARLLVQVGDDDVRPGGGQHARGRFALHASAVALGGLADTWGRRFMFVLEMLMFLVFLVGLSLAPDLGWLLFFLCLRRFGSPPILLASSLSVPNPDDLSVNETLDSVAPPIAVNGSVPSNSVWHYRLTLTTY